MQMQADKLIKILNNKQNGHKTVLPTSAGLRHDIYLKEKIITKYTYIHICTLKTHLCKSV